MIKLILFDLGGVLCEDRNDAMLEKWLGKSTGLSGRELHKHVFAGTWHRLDKALSTKKDAMKRLRATIPGAKHLGNSFDEIGNFYYPRADVIRYARQLGKQSKTGVFSNMSVDLYKALKKRRFPFDAFDFHFLSFQMGKRKPEAQAYREVERRTGLRPGEILFIDDKERNLDPARLRGWKAIEYHGLNELKIKINKLIVKQ